MTDEKTANDATQATDASGVILDLRPPRNSIVYQLLRLGLSFDHRDAAGETWTDYTRGVIATFTGRETQEATLSDMDTKDSRTVSLTDLEKVTEIKTWRSDGAGD